MSLEGDIAIDGPRHITELMARERGIIAIGTCVAVCLFARL